MIRIIDTEDEIHLCSLIESSICNTNVKFPEKITRKNFNTSFFFPDSFIIREVVFDLLALNFNFNHESFLSCHNDGITTYFEFRELTKDKWQQFFEGKFENNFINADFVHFLYSDFVCIFDKSESWFYYHTKDFPNVLFTNKSLIIPHNLQASILSIKDVFDEVGEYLEEKEKIKLKQLFKTNYSS